MLAWFSHPTRNGLWLLLSVLFLIAGCKSAEYRAYVYDPIGATLTEDKPLDPYHRRTIGFAEDGVWFTNEFDGARLNDVVRVSPFVYELTISAENTPINNSAWYGFVVARGDAPWMHGSGVGDGSGEDLGGGVSQAVGEGDSRVDSLELTLHLRYEGGTHRYPPKLMERIGESLTEGMGSGSTYSYRQIDSIQTMKIMPEGENIHGLKLRFSVGTNPVLVTAQRLETSHSLQDTLQAWAARYPSVHVDTAGFSSENRPIPGLIISQDTQIQRPTLMVIGRQHPPEVPGYEVMRSFLHRFASNDSLANAFREAFHVVALPMANPDGVDRGHWRHNARGVDLNRDWINFNQQETQVARRYFQEKAATLGQPIYAIDFHSTQIHLMYPIEESVALDGPAISTPWFDHLLDPETGYPFEVAIEPFDTSGPVAKNWFWRAFGIDALTYEVSDLSTPEQNDTAGEIAAESLMKTLLTSLESLNSLN